MKNSRFLVWIAMILSAFVISACGGGSSSGGSSVSASSASSASTGGGGVVSSDEIFLNAFTDYACSPGWANRNGALGRVAYSGSGTCETPFPGESGIYAVFLQAQTENDGNSPYAVSINGTNVQEGNYPYSTGSLNCNCSGDSCPDQIVNLGAGIHEISTGDTIGFFGDDVYQCGEHGSYAKWQGMIFIRQ
ncbi:hypothetical protein N9H39_02475 [Gammaproteobacteria bacterium]|nr:hypothetical protein [Gammaproteobacteria bacterium]